MCTQCRLCVHSILTYNTHHHMQDFVRCAKGHPIYHTRKKTPNLPYTKNAIHHTYELAYLQVNILTIYK